MGKPFIVDSGDVASLATVATLAFDLSCSGKQAASQSRKILHSTGPLQM